MGSENKKLLGGSISAAKPVSCQEGGWCDIVCDCGQIMPIVQTSFVQLLTRHNIPEGTPIERLKFHGCPSCQNEPGLYVAPV